MCIWRNTNIHSIRGTNSVHYLEKWQKLTIKPIKLSMFLTFWKNWDWPKLDHLKPPSLITHPFYFFLFTTFDLPFTYEPFICPPSTFPIPPPLYPALPDLPLPNPALHLPLAGYSPALGTPSPNWGLLRGSGISKATTDTEIAHWKQAGYHITHVSFGDPQRVTCSLLGPLSKI